MHERALQAVRSVSNTAEGETATKEIIADVLRRFLLLENASLDGSEEIFVFGVAGKLCAYSRIANALRETWGNDARLRSHDIALSQQLQNGHIDGSAHWTGEEDEWQETDPDYGESAEPWCDDSSWHDTKGYEYELHSEGTDWNENCYETHDYGTTVDTFSEPIPALLDQPVETHEGDVNKLETVQEAVAAANAATDMSRRTWTQARQLMKDVHRSRGYFSSLERQPNDGSGSWSW